MNVKARQPSEQLQSPIKKPAIKKTASIPDVKRKKEMLLSAPLKKTASFPDVKRRIMDVKARQLSPSVTVSSVARACLRFSKLRI